MITQKLFFQNLENETKNVTEIDVRTMSGAQFKIPFNNNISMLDWMEVIAPLYDHYIGNKSITVTGTTRTFVYDIVQNGTSQNKFSNRYQLIGDLINPFEPIFSKRIDLGSPSIFALFQGNLIKNQIRKNLLQKFSPHSKKIVSK
jgi:hypothetical protein